MFSRPSRIYTSDHPKHSRLITHLPAQTYDKAIKELKKLYKNQFDFQTAKSLSPYLRRSVQKWDQSTLKFVALNCHLQLCCVYSDLTQEIVGEQYAAVTWGVPTDHDKVHKGEGLQVYLHKSFTRWTKPTIFCSPHNYISDYADNK